MPEGVVDLLKRNLEHPHWDAVAERPRYAYFPFGGGPRRCIGEAFALAEIPIVLATLAQRFRVRLAPGRGVEARPLFTLRPHGGIWVTLERRTPRSLH